ncbi:hypothetical protein PVAP13_4KG175000 [Panicum virgatum]|uniref:Uncharacterized protein n=1 Tax=Panicum virgatum TaxID=38727 RepID=A0A8T0TGZ0_PANVG|nr:hypothetical protein PVAP13_4KG175000 [Panicum virgatum]
MSAARRGSGLLCSFVSGERRQRCGEDGVPSSLIDGGFPASMAGECMRLGNKSGLFPAGGMDGGVKLLFLLILSVRLVLSSGARCSAVLGISSFVDCGVVRIVLLLLCERARDLVFPDVGLLSRIADLLSNGGSCFRSPAFGPVAAEPLSPPSSAVPTADVRSAFTIRFGGWPGDGSCGISKVLALLSKTEGGSCLAVMQRERGR